MNINDLIRKIIQLPQQFHRLGNQSIYALLKDSGYFENFDKVREEDISEILEKYPDIINDWMLWSDDKRCSSGWSFIEGEKGKYIVGYLSDGNKIKELEYSDKKLACAAFIKREIEDIRSL